jgi:hypothetical protein
LFSSDTRDDLTGQSSGNSTGTGNNVDVNTDSDDVLSKLNIDGLKTCERRPSLKLKVVLVHPNGNVVTRNPTNEKTVQIIRNLVVGGWTAVANAHVFKLSMLSLLLYSTSSESVFTSMHVNCLQYPVLFPDDCMAGGGEIIFCIAAEQEKIAAMFNSSRLESC